MKLLFNEERKEKSKKPWVSNITISIITSTQTKLIFERYSNYFEKLFESKRNSQENQRSTQAFTKNIEEFYDLSLGEFLWKTKAKIWGT